MACKHPATSLVDMTHRLEGEFLTVQCDVCGMVLPYAPIDDATIDAWADAKLKVARMDVPAYTAVVDRVWREVALGDLAPLVRFAAVAGKVGGAK